MFCILCALALVAADNPGSAREGDVASIIPKGHKGCEWLAVDGNAVWVGLVQDGRQIGAFNKETHEYFAVDPLNGAWIKGPDRVFHREDARAAIQLRNNPGVDWRRTQSEPSGYRIDGRPVTEAVAFAALKPSPKLADDSQLPSVTLIGTAAECKVVEEEIARNPKLRSIRQSFLLQSYRPGEAMVARYGFVSGGQPTIYMTDATGRVIWRSDGDPGADVLGDAVAAGVEQCCPPRKPSPDYQPDKDAPPERVIRRAAGIAWGWWIGGILGALLAFLVGFVAVMLAGLVAVKVVRSLRSPPVVPVVQADKPATA